MIRPSPAVPFLLLLTALLLHAAPARSAPAANATRLPAVVTPKVEWTPVYYKGRSYVPLTQVADYYDLKTPEVWGKAFALRREKLSIELAPGEKRVRLNGWTFFFSFPVVKTREIPMISIFDVRNVLDPILRPTDRRDPAILRTVILDPAGGGRDPGIESSAIDEKDLTLELAKVLATLLKNNGYKVVMTRETDKLVLPAARVRLANAITEEAVYLNLRAATSGTASVKGFECSTLPPAGTPATNESDSPDIDKRFFAGNISDRESLALAATIQNSVVSGASTIDLGVRRVRVDELRDLRMPAISCKLGYLSNKEESKKLADRDYRNRLAEAIVHGVDRYAGFLRRDMAQRAEEDRKRPLRFGPVIVREETAGSRTATETTTPDRSPANSPADNGKKPEKPEKTAEEKPAEEKSDPAKPAPPPSSPEKPPESPSAGEKPPEPPPAGDQPPPEAPPASSAPPLPADQPAPADPPAAPNPPAPGESTPAGKPADPADPAGKPASPPEPPAPAPPPEASPPAPPPAETSATEPPSATKPETEPAKPDHPAPSSAPAPLPAPPAETPSSEAKPEEEKSPSSSGETQPPAPKPADGKSADDKLTDDKPADDKPADGKPDDNKPAGTKPAAEKPEGKAKLKGGASSKKKATPKKNSSRKASRQRSPDNYDGDEEEDSLGKKTSSSRSSAKKTPSKPAAKPAAPAKPAVPAGPAFPGDRITLRLPIVASGTAPIDRSQVELQIFLFESVNDGEIDLTTSNPPETKWLSVLPDWRAGVPEWFQVSYLRPPFNVLEEKQYGKRSYYGYVARLIYGGRLMDETSYPPNLNRCLYYFTPVFPRR